MNNIRLICPNSGQHFFALAIVVSCVLSCARHSQENQGNLIPVQDILSEVDPTHERTRVEDTTCFQVVGESSLSGTYEIPMTNQSQRISFDICSNTKDPFFIIHISTIDHAGFVTIRPVDKGKDTILCSSGPSDALDHPEGEDVAVSGFTSTTEGKNGRWIAVELSNTKESLHVRIDNRHLTRPRVPGQRFAKIEFWVMPGVLVRNVRTFPSPVHKKASSLYLQAIAMTGDASLPPKMAMFREAASMGLADAQEAYGLFGSVGIGGVRISLDESFSWLMKAAEQGLPKAMNAIAGMYHTGKGTEEDENEALRWYREAAQCGDKDAQFRTAFLLMRGKTVVHDMKEAQLWLDKLTSYILFHPTNETVTLPKWMIGMSFYLRAETYILGRDGARKNQDLGVRDLELAAEFGDQNAKDLLNRIE